MREWDKVGRFPGHHLPFMRVWMVLVHERSRHTNMVTMTHQEIGDDANVSKRSTGAILKQMEKQEAIKQPGPRRILLNPDFVWSGKDTGYFIALRQFENMDANRMRRRERELEAGLKAFVGDGPSPRLLAKRAKAAEEAS